MIPARRLSLLRPGGQYHPRGATTEANAVVIPHFRCQYDAGSCQQVRPWAHCRNASGTACPWEGSPQAQTAASEHQRRRRRRRLPFLSSRAPTQSQIYPQTHTNRPILQHSFGRIRQLFAGRPQLLKLSSAQPQADSLQCRPCSPMWPSSARG